MSDVLAETKITELPFGQLLLDPENPRLLKHKLEHGELDEPTMVEALMASFDPMPVARSIVEFGFFATEPLIVFPTSDGYVVAEGNRRLVALKLLLDEALRDDVDADKEWDELAHSLAANPSRLKRLETIPCQEVPDRDAAAPIIGYRHIVGILKWDAFEKTAYVTSLIKQDPSRPFEDVGDLVGESPGKVKRRLRDWLVLEQADAAAIDISRPQQEYGRWERAMNAKGVREYIGAKTPASMESDATEGYDGEDDRVRKLLSFLYGEENGPDRLFSDTRRIDDLSAALQTQDGRDILEGERDLDRAFEAAGGRRDYVLKGFEKALKGLQQAGDDYPDYAEDDDVARALEAVELALAEIRSGALAPGGEDGLGGAEDFPLEDDEEDDDGEIGPGDEGELE